MPRRNLALAADQTTKGSFTMAIDNDKLHEFLGKFVTDLGATVAAGNVVIGHRLGLYKALAAGAATADELAAETQTSPRYVAEWLRGLATQPFGDITRIGLSLRRQLVGGGGRGRQRLVKPEVVADDHVPCRHRRAEVRDELAQERVELVVVDSHDETPLGRSIHRHG